MKTPEENKDQNHKLIVKPISNSKREDVLKNFDIWKKINFSNNELEEYQNEFKRTIKKLEEEFISTQNSMNNYSQKKGLILPKNEIEFFRWCCENIPGFAELKLNQVKIQRSWLVEFSKDQERIIEEEGLNEISNEWQPIKPASKQINKPTTKAKPTLSLKQIALIHIYSDKPISKENAKSIASEYGFKSKTSGQKLIQYYNKYFKRIDRTGDEETKQKNRNKYNLIESILPYLENEKQQTAKNELEVIKKNYL